MNTLGTHLSLSNVSLSLSSEFCLYPRDDASLQTKRAVSLINNILNLTTLLDTDQTLN
jgi:hypothetical protein